MRQGLVGASQNPAERPVLRQAKAEPAASPAKPAPQASIALASFAPVKVQKPAKATTAIAGDFVLSASEKVAAVQAAPAPVVPEAAPIMYISSRSVNVRQGPSTDYEVVGRLVRAEAVSVISPEENGLVRIAIEGDGLEGYIAARLLSDTEPSGN
jgi:uncharacterized protein YgiM (DUF1202 family)